MKNYKVLGILLPLFLRKIFIIFSLYLAFPFEAQGMVADDTLPRLGLTRGQPSSPSKTTPGLREGPYEDSGFQESTPSASALRIPGDAMPDASTPSGAAVTPDFLLTPAPVYGELLPPPPDFASDSPPAPAAAEEPSQQVPLLSLLPPLEEADPDAPTPAAAAASNPSLTPAATGEEPGQDTSHLIPNPFLSLAELGSAAHPTSFGSHPFQDVLRVLTQASLLNFTRTEGDAKLTTLIFGEPMTEEDTFGTKREPKPRWTVHVLRTAAPHGLLIHMGEAIVYMECNPRLISKSFKKAPVQTQANSRRKGTLNDCISPPVKEMMHALFPTRCGELLGLFFPFDQYQRSQHFRKTSKEKHKSPFIHFLFSSPTTESMPNTWYVTAGLRRTVGPSLCSLRVDVPELPSFCQLSQRREKEFVPTLISSVNALEACLLRSGSGKSIDNGAVTRADEAQGRAE